MSSYQRHHLRVCRRRSDGTRAFSKATHQKKTPLLLYAIRQAPPSKRPYTRRRPCTLFYDPHNQTSVRVLSVLPLPPSHPSPCTFVCPFPLLPSRRLPCPSHPSQVYPTHPIPVLSIQPTPFPSSMISILFSSYHIQSHPITSNLIQ